MNKNIESRLKAQFTFPSPPGVAQQIIELANDPEAHISAVAAVINKDPALALKILRIANSALYSRRRRSDNLRQALTVLGLRAATTLALSFSIAPMYRKKPSKGLNYNACWRRALLSAAAARSLGSLTAVHRPEDLFLAALLQDIAMIALDQADPNFYKELSANANHHDITEYERSRLETDHAAIGAMLLKHWQLPQYLSDTVEHSHQAPANTGSDAFITAVQLGATTADVFMQGGTPDSLLSLSNSAKDACGLTDEQTGELIEVIVRHSAELGQLFDNALLSASESRLLMERARDLLSLRSLQSIELISDLEAKTDELAQRTEALENRSRLDGLTGAYTRTYLEDLLAREFAAAHQGPWPLSLIFLDLDHFKHVNDNHGHAAGDSVLRASAQLLMRLVRTSDYVARYGGEEFVLLMPGLDQPGATALCDRILRALRNHVHQIAGRTLIVTASIGLAVTNNQHRYDTHDDLVRAADKALYGAKKAGRDRWLLASVAETMASKNSA